MRQIVAASTIFAIVPVAQAYPVMGAATSVPTLSEWGLILLVGLIGLAAFRALRRRA